MTIEETITYLHKFFPEFGKKVMYDIDNKGNDFCEIVYPNPTFPTMPIAVSISDNGCQISVGQIENVTGDSPIPPDHAVDAIHDIISDKIIFVLGFSEDDDIGSGAPFFSRIFALTEKGDDMSEAYDRFIEKISTPIKGFKRHFTKLKGRFVIMNFSGTVNKTIIR